MKQEEHSLSISEKKEKTFSLSLWSNPFTRPTLFSSELGRPSGCSLLSPQDLRENHDEPDQLQ
jgi:hypothetical protein